MFLCLSLKVSVSPVANDGIAPSSLMSSRRPRRALCLCRYWTRLAISLPTPSVNPSNGSSLDSFGEVRSPASFVFHSSGSQPRPSKKFLVSSPLPMSICLRRMRLKGPAILVAQSSGMLYLATYFHTFSFNLPLLRKGFLTYPKTPSFFVSRISVMWGSLGNTAWSIRARRLSKVAIHHSIQGLSTFQPYSD